MRGRRDDWRFSKHLKPHVEIKLPRCDAYKWGQPIGEKARCTNGAQFKCYRNDKQLVRCLTCMPSQAALKLMIAEGWKVKGI